MGGGMSHAATKWAFDQPELHRDMKPSEWAVLMVLADCHNPVNGCFPSQDYICQKTNLAERAVRDQLARLRERGLIDWDAARDGQRRGSNRYRLGFEPDFQPANSAGREDAASTGKIGHSQPADSDALNRQNLPPNPVREPVKEPEREGAREAQETENRKAVERGFEKAFRTWPTSISDSRPEALKVWFGLDADERERAGAEIGRYVEAVKATGRKLVCAFAVYLREKRWDHLPEPEPEKAAPAYAPAFGPVWSAIRMRDLVTGQKQPTPLKAWEQQAVREGRLELEMLERSKRANSGWPAVNGMHERAATRGGGVSGFGATEERLGKITEFVPIDTEIWEAWRLEHELRGWPWLPDPGGMGGAYFPKGGPHGLADFEAAVKAGKGGEDDGGRSQAA
jgi:hypothetical protein